MNNNSAKTIVLNAVKTLTLPVLVVLIFAVLSGGKYGTWDSINATLRNSCQAIIMAWGTMFIIAGGMWDFSAGAQIFFSCMLATKIIMAYKMGPVGMIVTLLVLNVAMRAVVGLIYSLVHTKSMVVTLALCMIFESLCKFIFGTGTTLKNRACLVMANSPWCYIFVAAMAIITVVIWYYTKFSFHVRALGSGERVARNIGLSPAKMRFEVFLVQGLYLGIASVLMLATRSNVAAPTNLSSSTLVFNALMAGFIGIALERFSNRIIGVAIGALVMSMLSSGLLAMGVNSAWQTTITGVFMALFIGFSMNQQRFYQHFANVRRAKEANAKLSRA